MSISPESSLDAPQEPSGPLFGIAAAAFVAYWVVTPGIYQLATGRAIVATTQPTSQPFPSIDPHDLIALSIASPVVGLITLVIANILWLKHPFQKLGWTWARLRAGGWMVGFTSAIIVVPLTFAVVVLTQKFWDWLHFAHPSEHDLLRVLGVEPSAAIRLAIVVSAIVLAPMFEEFFFRGMLQRAIRLTTKNRWIAIVITSIAFAAVHGALWMAPPIFFLSLCLGYLYEGTGDLWVPMIVHAAFNASSVVMFLFHR